MQSERRRGSWELVSQVKAVAQVVIALVELAVMSVLITLLTQPAYRNMQWVAFGEKVRSVDRVGRERGWVLIAASLRPGWLWGHGEIEWARGSERWSSTFRVAPGSRAW